jgi:transcription initiation factor TFIIA small subunit
MAFSIGITLTDTLDDLISEHRIDPQLAMKILANFDRAIAEALQEKVKSRLTFKVRISSACRAPSDMRAAYCVLRPASFSRTIHVRLAWLEIRTASSEPSLTRYVGLQGSLDTYRFCDEVWTFLIKNVSFKMDNGGQVVFAEKVKIVSCNARRPGEAP